MVTDFPDAAAAASFNVAYFTSPICATAAPLSLLPPDGVSSAKANAGMYAKNIASESSRAKDLLLIFICSLP